MWNYWTRLANNAWQEEVYCKLWDEINFLDKRHNNSFHLRRVSIISRDKQFQKKKRCLTFEHFNSNCSLPRPSQKVCRCSLGNLTKSTFTNDLFYSHVIPCYLPRTCLWIKWRVYSAPWDELCGCGLFGLDWYGRSFSDRVASCRSMYVAPLARVNCWEELLGRTGVDVTSSIAYVILKKRDAYAKKRNALVVQTCHPMINSWYWWPFIVLRISTLQRLQSAKKSCHNINSMLSEIQTSDNILTNVSLDVALVRFVL